MKENNNKIHQESLFTEEECPTVDSQSPKEFRKEEHRFNTRLTSLDSIKRINNLLEQYSIPRNTLFNEIIEMGLPLVERKYGILSKSEEQSIINNLTEIIETLKQQNKILLDEIQELKNDKQNYYQSLRDELTHINATTSIQEYINSSTYEHLKFLLNIFIATQGAGKMSEELSRSYDNRIAEQFLEKKIDALSNFKKTNKVQFVKTKEGDEK